MSPKTVTRRFWSIVLLTVAAIVISLPKRLPIRFSIGSFKVNTVISSPRIDWRFGEIEFRRDLSIKKGLDLQGGTQMILEANMDGIAETDRKTSLESAKSVIARRVDLYGISETVIQTAQTPNSYRLIVELPGVTDPEEAKNLIGQTAKLEFWESEDPDGKPKPTDLTGKDLERAGVEFDQQTGQPVVSLIFTPEGKEKFSEITKRNVGKRVGIYLDGVPLTIPVVQTAITEGRAIITGDFTTKTAKQLAVNLNAGALPVNLNVISQTKIGATLGQQSVSASIKAGSVGLAAVAIFMIVVYRKLGLIADAALIIYGLLTLSIYKLIPVTLTLPGIAGFILSVGMATDANILIFERTKEELKRGHKLRAAVELGFGRAWDSIKDANATTLLTAFILYNPFDWKFLNTTGLVRGFALTLTIGIIISLFTGIIVSRTLIRMFYVKQE